MEANTIFGLEKLSVQLQREGIHIYVDEIIYSTLKTELQLNTILKIANHVFVRFL